MASLSRTARGGYVVQFMAGRDRRTIHLGTLPHKTAEQTRLRIEALLACAQVNAPADPVTAAWLAGLGDDMVQRLVRAGLLADREREALGPMLDRYIDQRQELKPGSLVNLKATARLLTDYFRPGCELRSIDAQQADEWVASLRSHYSPASVSRHIKRARQFFRVAVRWQLIADNPFVGIVAPDQVNAARSRFVPAELVRHLIANTRPSFGLVLALARFGGLRVPSELGLRWNDIDWRSGRVTVPSPKTGDRTMPLFPELREHLEPARRDNGVICAGMTLDKNMRTRLLRLIERCGFSAWPRLFHNMRASRQTELASAFPLRAVCEWLGNSPAVAAKHYLQVQDDDFTRATQETTAKGALQSALQHPDATTELPDEIEASILRFPGMKCNSVTLTGFPAQNPPAVKYSEFCRSRGGCAAIRASDGLGLLIRRWDGMTVRAKFAARRQAAA